MDEWIEIEWKLPDTGQRALVYPVYDDIAIGEYDGEGMWIVDNIWVDGRELTHWMLLPSRPKSIEGTNAATAQNGLMPAT